MLAVSNTSGYDFLAFPPQKQKKRPAQLRPVPPVNILLPLPTVSLSPEPTHRRRATTLTSRAAPGTPAAQSPPSVSYVGRTSAHTRPNSYSSILRLLEPQQDPSLVAFVQFPDTMAPLSENVNPSPPEQQQQQTFTTALKRIRSFGNLTPKRTRSRSITSVAPPPSPTRQRSKSIVQPPKSKPSKVKARTDLPPTLQQAVLVHQFLGGGTFDDNVKYMNRKRAKVEAKRNGKNPADAVVSDPYRDANGCVWQDRDEALEYTSLLRQDDGDIEEWTRDGQSSLNNPEMGFEDSFVPLPLSQGKVIRSKKSRPNVRDLFNTN